MFTSLQCQILKRFAPQGSTLCDGKAYIGKSKLAVLLGSDIFSRLTGKVVLDFGCGEGADTVEIAQKGAKNVIGLDIRESVLEVARQRATDADVTDRCIITGLRRSFSHPLRAAVCVNESAS